MSTHDDDNDELQGGANTESGLHPVQAPMIRSGNDAPPPQEEFDVIETGPDGEELVRGFGQQPREEANLSEDEAGDRPLIDGGAGGSGQQRQDRLPRSQRNARRRESRDRVYSENKRLNGEVSDLRTRLERFEGVVTPRLTELGQGQIQQRVGDLNNALANADATYKATQARLVTAMQSADTEGAIKALEDRDNALIRRTQLQNEKASVDKMLEEAGKTSGARVDTAGREQQRGGDQQQQRPQPLPTRAQNHATEFFKEFPWFDANNRTDIDSNIVRAIDQSVAEEGFDPSSPDYWDEIRDRMEQKMPWLATQGDGGQQPRQQQPQRQGGVPAQQRQQQPTPQRRGPAQAAPAERQQPSSQRKQVRISPDRKNAMIDAGIIAADGSVLDKKKYQSVLGKYAEFDRTNAKG